MESQNKELCYLRASCLQATKLEQASWITVLRGVYFHLQNSELWSQCYRFSIQICLHVNQAKANIQYTQFKGQKCCFCCIRIKVITRNVRPLTRKTCQNSRFRMWGEISMNSKLVAAGNCNSRPLTRKRQRKQLGIPRESSHLWVCSPFTEWRQINMAARSKTK